ncbi:MAG: manganese/zinc/iron transport system permease protein [Rhodobacteraceae bacterium HLUCCA12]|nr:MAG: manganese/zinc/iron transport system permease protein [Rhodobacteraceae bacterium HLUCCA12]
MSFDISHTLVTVAMAAALIGALAGVLGSFLVLRGQSLLGDVISHAALPGVVGGFLIAGGRSFAAILLGALAAGALAGLSVQGLRRVAGVKPDAALGVVLSLFFAAGVVLYSLAQARPGAAGVEVFLYGQAASVLRTDLPLMAGVALAVLAVIAALWKEFQFVSFDPQGARAAGLPVDALETALSVLVAIAIVLGLALAGVVLMVAMLIAPAVAARQWVDRLAPMVILAALFGAGSGVVGAALSAMGDGVATGPVMVLAATVVVALSLVLAPGRGALAQALARVTARRRLQRRQVLDALRGLSVEHGNPGHRSEEAMIDTYLGASARPVLERLEGEGLIRRDVHGPDRRPHWALTARGQQAAEGRE